MKQKQVNKHDVARAILLAILMASITGCEVGGKAWVSPIDTHSEFTTYKRRPLKCLFTNCEGDIKTEEQGS